MNENEIENISEEIKKRKKKRKHKKKIINNEINGVKTDEINHDFGGDSTIKLDDCECSTNSHKIIQSDTKNSNINKDKNDTETNVFELKKQNNGDNISQNHLRTTNITEIPRSSSIPQQALLHDLPHDVHSSAPELVDVRKSQSEDSVITVISTNRIYQPLTFKSLRSTFSTKIHQSELCNNEQSQLQIEMKNELMKYFPERKANIMVITWNMAGVSTYPEKLLHLIENSNIDELCDLYLLCFQETTPNKNELLSRIQMTFGGHYVIYNYVENGSLLGILVGHKRFIWNLGLIGKGSLSTRVTPITKGTVAISFQFFGNTIVFLGSHFSSGMDISGDKGKNRLRLEDYNSILYSKELIKILTTPNMKLGPDEKNLSHYFDYTFWAGDLNFRILREDVTVARLILSELCQNDGAAFEELLEYDELINNQVAGLIFQEFEEGRIMFLPTYNFNIDTNEYNEKRTPSYTDRILFKSQKSRRIECIHYNSVTTYTCSDHKPVCAIMEVMLEPQYNEHLKSSGIFNQDIYTKCFNECEMKQREPSTTPQSKMCSIQ